MDMPPVVLVTGASGFLGRSLVNGALKRGWRVHAAVRPGSASGLPGPATVHEIDLTADIERWRKAMSGVDWVIHAAARAHILRETASDPARAFNELNVQATRTLATAAADRGVRRFVFVSSIGVNGSTSGARPFDERTGEHPATPYAISKRDAEQVLRSMPGPLETVIVRPPLVYGPHVKANFLRLLRMVDRGIPLPFGALKNRRSFICVENLTDLLLTCAMHPAAAGKTFLASDGSDFSTPQLMRELAVRMRRSSRLIPVPAALLRWSATLAGRRSLFEQLCCSLEVDGSSARQTLEWRPPLAPEAALDAMVQWYLGAARGNAG